MRLALLLLVLLAASPASVAQSVPFAQDFTSALVQGTERSLAALWSDYDSDGDLDLLVTDVDGARIDDLYRNEGGGTFTPFQVPTNANPFATTTAGTFADFNDDGDLDFAGASLSSGDLYLNRGSFDGVPDFRYRRTRLDDYPDVREAAAADFDGDGRLDVLLVRRFGQPNVLIRNDGVLGIGLHSGDVYNDMNDSASACWGDVDNDGDPDLLITNISPANRYYINQAGTLTRDTSQPFLSLGESAGCAWGDYDADGDLDLAITLQDATTGGATQLFRNDSGSFAPVPIETRQFTASGLAWGDVDNDGDLDLVVAYREGQRPTLYLNDDSGKFTPLDFGTGAEYAVAVTLVDDDQDGDLDLFITNGAFLFFEHNQLYRNTTDGADGGGSWLAVDLDRPSGRNPFGVGAHVYAYVTVGGVPRTLLRPVQTLSGWHAQNGNRVHFGLGDATVVDSLVVDWPQGIPEDRTVLYDVAVNQIITVGGGSMAGSSLVDVAETSEEASATFAVGAAHPNPSRHGFTLTVRSGDGEAVRVEVLDVLGRRVQVLEAEGAAGATVPLYWDGMDAEGCEAPAGLYVLRVRQGTREDVVKVTLLR